jgi:hypothetical protein
MLSRPIILEQSGWSARFNFMSQFAPTLVLLTLMLGACSPSLAVTTTPPVTDPTSTSIPISDSPTIASPTDASILNPCGYQWAYNDLPELTAQFDQAVQDLIPSSNSHATAFGENCVGNDGQIVNFLTTETDSMCLLPSNHWMITRRLVTGSRQSCNGWKHCQTI